jgi:hypothetical protein
LLSISHSIGVGNLLIAWLCALAGLLRKPSLDRISDNLFLISGEPRWASSISIQQPCQQSEKHSRNGTVARFLNSTSMKDALLPSRQSPFYRTLCIRSKLFHHHCRSLVAVSNLAWESRTVLLPTLRCGWDCSLCTVFPDRQSVLCYRAVSIFRWRQKTAAVRLL